MCEFTVFLDTSVVWRDVVYAKRQENNVLLKDVLGASKTIAGCRIAEVDVSSERLVLASEE